MKISELPQDIREKALAYIVTLRETYYDGDSLKSAFEWNETKEGINYWSNWHYKEFDNNKQAIEKLQQLIDRKETTNKNGKNDFDIIQLKEIINLLK